MVQVVSANTAIKTSSLPTSRALRVSERVENRLRNSAYSALRSLYCETYEGITILRGRLPTYYLKQIAQTVATQVEGVTEIVNRIEVVPPAGHLSREEDS
jgi:osmotically-inducible protein OsmY